MMGKSVVRYPRSRWAELVLDEKASGLTKAEWCREHGVTVSALNYWTKWYEGIAPEPPLMELEPKSAAIQDPAETNPRNDLRNGTFIDMTRFLSDTVVGTEDETGVEDTAGTGTEEGGVAGPKITLQVGRYQIHISDGFLEETLAGC